MIGKKSTRNQNLVFIKCLLMAFSQCLKPFERSGPTSVSVFGALSISYGTSISNYTYFCSVLISALVACLATLPFCTEVRQRRQNACNKDKQFGNGQVKKRARRKRRGISKCIMVMVNSSNPANFMPPPLAWHNGIRQIKIYGASESCNCNVVSTGMQTGWLSELDSGPCCAARIPRKERRQLGEPAPCCPVVMPFESWPKGSSKDARGMQRAFLRSIQAVGINDV